MASPNIIFGDPDDFRMYNISRIATVATTTTVTVIKTTPGIIRTINVNTVGAATGTVLVEDGTASGATIIASISGTAPSGTNFIYDGLFQTGLTVVAASGSPDITITWK